MQVIFAYKQAKFAKNIVIHCGMDYNTITETNAENIEKSKEKRREM